ncbi:MAG: hypothetical protein WCF44_09645 [Candidatus Methylophosphatis roskildensis]
MPTVPINLVLFGVIVVVFRRYRDLKRERFVRDQPLLFAIDAKLGLADGLVYPPDCREARRRGDNTANCAGDFGDSSVDGSTDGFGDSDSGGDGGCGGRGCGGGD